MSRRIHAIGSQSLLSSLFNRDPRGAVYYCEPGITYPNSVLAIDYDLAHLQTASPANGRLAELYDVADCFERLVVNLPRYEPMAQMHLDICAAARVLSPTGRLWYIMPDKSGHTRVQAMLHECFGEVTVRSRRPRLFECTRPIVGTCTVPRQSIDCYDSASGQGLIFATRPGLFSADKVDRGTRLLLEIVEIPLGSAVLDVGCGYGAIGATAAARGARPVMVDSDSRAVALALENLRRNHLAGEVIIATGLDDFKEGSFDIVLANPPTHGGHALLLALFSGMVRVCRTTGYSAVVLHAHLDYERWIGDFASVEKLGEAGGYKVLELSPKCARQGPAKPA